MRVDADGELANAVCPRARTGSSPDEGECNPPCSQRPLCSHPDAHHMYLFTVTFIVLLQFVVPHSLPVRIAKR